MIVLFWLAVAVVVYAYVGFPALLWVRAAVWPRPWYPTDVTPRVSVVIAAYNEARNIEARIENLLAQDYPAEQLEIVVASDGSNDRTCEIVERFRDQGVRLLSLPRQGKGSALNSGVDASSGEILVFSDANTCFRIDSVRELVRHFADSTVGGVAGNQVYLRGDVASSTADGERLYWDFDQWLKSLQSRAGSVTSATGAIYAVRRKLYECVPPGVMDDVFISAAVIARGYRLVYSAAAHAYEPVAEVDGVEFSRKLRVITQGLQAVACRRDLFNPFRYGFYSWQLFSHKVLRRLVGVPLLAAMAICPWLWREGLVYQVAAVAEAAFLAVLATAVVLRGTRWGKLKPLAIAWYFAMVTTAALVAVYSLARGRRVYRWEPERHQVRSPSPTRECAEITCS